MREYLMSHDVPVFITSNSCTSSSPPQVEALQLSYQKSIATPANWPNNHADIPMADGTRSTEYKGSVFLLPTVSEEDAKKSYPNYHSCEVPSKINYLRLVKKEDVEAAA